MNNTDTIIIRAADRLGISYSGMGELHQQLWDMLHTHTHFLTPEEIKAIEAVIAEDELQEARETGRAWSNEADLRYHIWEIGVKAGLLHPAQKEGLYCYAAAMDFCEATPYGWDVLANDIIDLIMQQGIKVAEAEVAQAKASI